MKIYPSVEEIKEKYQSFKTVPVSTEIEADVSALTVLKKLKNVSSHCYMLESNDDANNTGRYTLQDTIISPTTNVGHHVTE